MPQDYCKVVQFCCAIYPMIIYFIRKLGKKIVEYFHC